MLTIMCGYMTPYIACRLGSAGFESESGWQMQNNGEEFSMTTRLPQPSSMGSFANAPRLTSKKIKLQDKVNRC
jgi:hypothetical protein